MRRVRVFYLAVLGAIFVLNSCFKATNNASEATNYADKMESVVAEAVINAADDAGEAEFFFDESSIYEAEISDLNGTWQPDRSYKITLEMPEEKRKYSKREFSWGEGKNMFHTTFEVDITAETPFVIEPGLGYFPITNISQTGINKIKINAFRASLDDPQIGWAVEFVFNFVDKDTLWIETKNFSSIDYGRGKLWYRISGPE